MKNGIMPLGSPPPRIFYPINPIPPRDDDTSKEKIVDGKGRLDNISSIQRSWRTKRQTPGIIHVFAMQGGLPWNLKNKVSRVHVEYKLPARAMPAK